MWVSRLNQKRTILKIGSSFLKLIVLKKLSRNLLNFSFFEIHMLTRNRVILTLDHFLGHCPRVLFRYVVKACVSGAYQLNLNCCWLSHRHILGLWVPAYRELLSGQSQGFQEFHT